ncbi:PREDICTED: glutathione S-transferase T3-like [Brassica oleracea var. oleracea]|uniref:glutathione S-transferase T3-like n=1 Tax=Brassica oleracea var. oleracea TaxID=109376 RepID=UPI0006A6AC54|nr:PREDICTED: glutathione S-transferase T3-like [Brassica oleracea var. oleracea]
MGFTNGGALRCGPYEIPAFSSQQSEDASVDTPVERLIKHKWTPADDEVLITSPHGGEDGEKREHLHCKKRWQRINDQVNKLCAAYSAAERQISSGENDTDVLKKAHDIFFSDQEHKLNLEHAWCVLRYEQKWLSLNTPKASGVLKRKNVETKTQTSSNYVVDTESRPKGIKVAKAKRNTAKGKFVAEYATIWEMKKEDLEMKKRLSKLAILDTFLAKKEPLSEAEEVVKNKLLAEYF